MSAEKQAILDKYIKLFHEYHDCLHCLNVGCNDRGKNDRRCCFQGNNLCVSWIENLAQEISALYIKETGQQATNKQRNEIKPCSRLSDCAFVRQEGFCCNTKCKVYNPV